MSQSFWEHLCKGTLHRYIKREKNKTPPPNWRYWYRAPASGIVSKDSVHVGAKFQYGHADEAGHLRVLSGPDNEGRYVFEHDETGEVFKKTPQEMNDMLNEHHKITPKKKEPKKSKPKEPKKSKPKEPKKSKPKEPEPEPVKPKEPESEPVKPKEPESEPVKPKEPEPEPVKPKEPKDSFLEAVKNAKFTEDELVELSGLLSRAEGKDLKSSQYATLKNKLVSRLKKLGLDKSKDKETIEWMWSNPKQAASVVSSLISKPVEVTPAIPKPEPKPIPKPTPVIPKPEPKPVTPKPTPVPKNVLDEAAILQELHALKVSRPDMLGHAENAVDLFKKAEGQDLAKPENLTLKTMLDLTLNSMGFVSSTNLDMRKQMMDNPKETSELFSKFVGQLKSSLSSSEAKKRKLNAATYPLYTNNKALIDEIADEKDGWRTLAEGWLRKGKLVDRESKKKSLEKFLKNPLNVEKAQKLWDQFGVAIVPPIKGEVNIPESSFKQFYTELELLNDAFDVRNVVAHLGITMSFSSDWSKAGAGKKVSDKYKFGGTRANYEINNHHINLLAPTASAPSFVHELFHALDHMHGARIAGKVGVMMSDPRKFTNTYEASKVPSGVGSLKHYIRSELPSHKWMPVSYKGANSFNKYLNDPIERFARLAQDFFHPAFGKVSYTMDSVRELDGKPKTGYWGAEIIGKEAEKISEHYKALGVSIKDSYIKKLKEEGAKISGSATPVEKQKSGDWYKTIYDQHKDKSWADTPIEAKKNLVQAAQEWIKNIEKKPIFNTNVTLKKKLDEIRDSTDKASKNYTSYDVRKDLIRLQAMEGFINKSFEIKSTGFRIEVLKKSGFRTIIQR